MAIFKDGYKGNNKYNNNNNKKDFKGKITTMTSHTHAFRYCNGWRLCGSKRK